MNLNIVNQDGQLLVDSREVAEMTEKRHDHLLRDIETYKAVLDETPNLGSQNFFIESSYKAVGNNKSYKCFLLTRKGCDMVANKLTGEKGILFTAAYVTKFEEMEIQLKPKTQLEILQASINQLVDQERRLADVETRLIETEKKQDNITEIVSLNNIEWRKKVNTILQRIAKAMGGFEAYKEIRSESYKFLEQRANCKLSVRLTNKQQKMSLEGVQKSKIDKLTKMDVIADDSRLTEIYLAIVKEMAIKYQVEAG